MTAPAILAENIRKFFGKVKALDGFDLEVDPGTVLGLLGPNGAGKTTAVRIFTTLLVPDEGRAEVAGYDVVRDATILRTVIGLAGQYAAVDPNLTGLENLELVGRLYHLDGAEAHRRAQDVLGRFGLSDAATRTVHHANVTASLSRREWQLLAFFLANTNRYYEARDVIDQVWDREISTEQFRSYLTRIRRKLEPLRLPFQIVTRPGVGYALNMDLSPVV